MLPSFEGFRIRPRAQLHEVLPAAATQCSDKTIGLIIPIVISLVQVQSRFEVECEIVEHGLL